MSAQAGLLRAVHRRPAQFRRIVRQQFRLERLTWPAHLGRSAS
jgi:hypothetical protein